MEPHKLSLLPPKIDLSQVISLIGKANGEVGNFNGALKHILKFSNLLINPLAAKEAEASSKIEGTQATASDAFKSAIGEKDVPDDVRHILNYKKAILVGMDLLEKGVPLVGRVLKEMQSALVKNVRGQNRKPGEWRDQIVWIGPEGSAQDQATYVPPLPQEIPDLFKNLEEFIHSEFPDNLVQAAIIHYQFEAIHPFFDGNGRIGRSIIPFFLYYKKNILLPMLYISSYFEQNRIDYYAHLKAVTESGKWLEWIEFFLKGIIISAKRSQQNIEKLLDVKEKYYKFAQESGFKYAHIFVDSLFENPFVTTGSVKKKLNITSDVTAINLIKKFVEFGILMDLSPEKKRRKYFVAHELHRIVEN